MWAVQNYGRCTQCSMFSVKPSNWLKYTLICLSKMISEGTIYKIVCKDANVKDCYVGSTADYKARVRTHRWACTANPPSKRQNCTSVYQFIRANGGWDNWEVKKVKRYYDISREDLRKKEKNANAVPHVTSTTKPVIWRLLSIKPSLSPNNVYYHIYVI